MAYTEFCRLLGSYISRCFKWGKLKYLLDSRNSFMNRIHFATLQFENMPRMQIEVRYWIVTYIFRVFMGCCVNLTEILYFQIICAAGTDSSSCYWYWHQWSLFSWGMYSRYSILCWNYTVLGSHSWNIHRIVFLCFVYFSLSSFLFRNEINQMHKIHWTLPFCPLLTHSIYGDDGGNDDDTAECFTFHISHFRLALLKILITSKCPNKIKRFLFSVSSCVCEKCFGIFGLPSALSCTVHLTIHVNIQHETFISLFCADFFECSEKM